MTFHLPDKSKTLANKAAKMPRAFLPNSTQLGKFSVPLIFTDFTRDTFFFITFSLVLYHLFTKCIYLLHFIFTPWYKSAIEIVY